MADIAEGGPTVACGRLNSSRTIWSRSRSVQISSTSRWRRPPISPARRPSIVSSISLCIKREPASHGGRVDLSLEFQRRGGGQAVMATSGSHRRPLQTLCWPAFHDGGPAYAIGGWQRRTRRRRLRQVLPDDCTPPYPGLARTTRGIATGLGMRSLPRLPESRRIELSDALRRPAPRQFLDMQAVRALSRRSLRIAYRYCERCHGPSTVSGIPTGWLSRKWPLGRRTGGERHARGPRPQDLEHPPVFGRRLARMAGSGLAISHHLDVFVEPISRNE